MPRSLDRNRLRPFEPMGSQAVDVAMETKHAGSMPNVPEGDEGRQRWPSRETIRNGRISIETPLDVIERVRAMYKDDRRTYANMLGHPDGCPRGAAVGQGAPAFGSTPEHRN